MEHAVCHSNMAFAFESYFNMISRGEYFSLHRLIDGPCWSNVCWHCKTCAALPHKIALITWVNNYYK